jgi:NAD(P)-dependent dehydrogenase (short-subunit alcohol dehydrogenase family)
MVERVVDVDVKGVIFGSQVAIKGMLKQGFGHLYNMEGFGSNGRTRAGISVYGAAKSALRFLTRSLTVETKETPVKVSSLSPGIVITDFITGQYEDDAAGFERARRIFKILGDKPETVTPWLAERVLENDKSGANISWLKPGMIMWRFMAARFNRRDLFA